MIKLHSILVVDDEPDNFDVLETFLSEHGYQLHYAASGQDAIASLEIVHPDLILLDVMMPGMDGIEVCQRIKAMSEWLAVPIIMVTALTTKKDLAECLTAGADDFISKPVNPLELRARVRSMLRIHQQYQELATFNASLEATVQERTAELQTIIFEDGLTKLPSRAFLVKKLYEILQAGETSFGVMTLDCDQFKLINGSFGHTVGNQLLIAIGERLKQHLRPQDLLVRMGEDEFCFLLRQMESAATLESFIQEILNSFGAPFLVENCEIFMTVCIGVAWQITGEQNPEELIQDADTAMYQAKLRGKGTYQCFDDQMRTAMLQRLTLENDLQRALERDEYRTYYQPIVHLPTQQLVGFEALVRWHHPTQGIVPPGKFIPCMETTGLIVPVGMVILKQSCTQLRSWQEQGGHHLTMSVNLSVRQFESPTLLADIDRVLEETGVNPACLKLEITESAIMQNADMAIALTQELRSRRIQICIDDFGTGYSSLSYLHRFPVDNLKIDRSFVQQIQSHTPRKQILETIITLAKRLDLSTTAEGIETAEQLQWLQQQNCEFGQGYFFAKPLPAVEITARYFAPSLSAV